MNKIKKEWLVCPLSKEKLKFKKNIAKSSIGTYFLDEEHGFWDFIPENELNNESWETWNELQQNGIVSYENDPANNLGVGKRKDFLSFAKFCNFNGLVLDVGVGPQKNPTHIKYCNKKNVQFIGIDPIVGEQPREFSFIRSLGEYLPFKSKLFDQVLFVTTLDHFIDPVIALKESKRVLKKDGEICIWLGEKDKNVPKPKKSNLWYEKLEVPKGADDPFHFKRFSISDFKKYLIESNLKITTEKVIEIDKWRKSCFYIVKNK